jgi:hypothetical protein
MISSSVWDQATREITSKNLGGQLDRDEWLASRFGYFTANGRTPIDTGYKRVEIGTGERSYTKQMHIMSM